jgi:hypothetical protein
VVATHGRFDRECRRVSCAQCGLVQQDPLPAQAELDAYYRSHAYRDEHGSVSIRWGPHGVIHPTDPRWPEAHKGMGISRMEQAIHLTKAEPGHVLDAYQEAGWYCYGLEPDEKEAAIALDKGHAVHPTTIEAYEPPRPFALIVAHPVLEHLHDPIGVLRKLRGWLADGGQMVIEVPDIMSPTGPLTRSHFQWPHLWDFSQATLTDAMMQAGFSVVAGAGTAALWAVGTPADEAKGEAGPGGEYMRGYLDGYRRFGGGD